MTMSSDVEEGSPDDVVMHTAVHGIKKVFLFQYWFLLALPVWQSCDVIPLCL